MRKVDNMEEEPFSINPDAKIKEYQLYCPFCNKELYRAFDEKGSKGRIMCDKCKKVFGFTFGKITQSAEFIGYMNVEGRLRMLMNGDEETFNLHTDKKMLFKRADEVLILWKKGVLDELRPKEIINYTNYFRKAL